MIEQQLEIPDAGILHENFITIKPGDPSSTLYCFFFNSDDLYLQYKDIACALPEDVRVMGIRRPECRSFCTIEEYAIDSVERILSSQKEGPFYLAGFCFGGLIALKAAMILEERGFQVNCCMIDMPYHKQKIKYYIEYGALYYLARRKWLYLRLNPGLRHELRRNAKKYNYKTMWKREFRFRGHCIIFLGKHMYYRDSYKGYELNLARHFDRPELICVDEKHLDFLKGPGSLKVAAEISKWFNS